MFVYRDYTPRKSYFATENVDTLSSIVSCLSDDKFVSFGAQFDINVKLNLYANDSAQFKKYAQIYKDAHADECINSIEREAFIGEILDSQYIAVVTINDDEYITPCNLISVLYSYKCGHMEVVFINSTDFGGDMGDNIHIRGYFDKEQLKKEIEGKAWIIN